MKHSALIGRIIYTLNTITVKGKSSMQSIRIAMKALREFCERDEDQMMLKVAVNAMNEISVVGESDISALVGCIEEIENLIMDFSKEISSDDHNDE